MCGVGMSCSSSSSRASLSSDLEHHSTRFFKGVKREVASKYELISHLGRGACESPSRSRADQPFLPHRHRARLSRPCGRASCGKLRTLRAVPKRKQGGPWLMRPRRAHMLLVQRKQECARSRNARARVCGGRQRSLGKGDIGRHRSSVVLPCCLPCCLLCIADGEVWAARDPQTRSDPTHKVAIKKICSAFSQATESKRILRELRILRHLKHPNVIKIREVLRPESEVGGGTPLPETPTAASASFPHSLGMKHPNVIKIQEVLRLEAEVGGLSRCAVGAPLQHQLLVSSYTPPVSFLYFNFPPSCAPPRRPFSPKRALRVRYDPSPTTTITHTRFAILNPRFIPLLFPLPPAPSPPPQSTGCLHRPLGRLRFC